jgi:hypothetical protein
VGTLAFPDFLWLTLVMMMWFGRPHFLLYYFQFCIYISVIYVYVLITYIRTKGRGGPRFELQKN